jgi:transposase
VDAHKLATLLFLDQVPPVYVPSLDVRSWRSLIEFRRRLTAKRTQVKNAMRSLLRGQGVELPRGAALWTRRKMAWLRGLELPSLGLAVQRDVLLEDLEQVNKQLGRVTAQLNTMARQHPGIGLLRTIPGVGPRTAEAVVAYIDRADRFRRNHQVGSYFGLVPCQDQSADKDRRGHITRQGPATVRWLVTQAAWQGVRRSPEIRAYFERIQGGDPQRKNIALIATTHYLLRVMHAMLRTGELWRGYVFPGESEAQEPAAPVTLAG